MTSRINQTLFGTIVCIPILVVAAITSAAPILGENQDREIVDRPSTPIIRPTAFQPDAAVIHFSVLPSPANPDRFETTIFVQKDGGRRICVNHTSPTIIVRSYQSGSDQFEPDIPAPIEGEESNDVGELAGFNNKKLFIRPRDTDDRFDSPEERFSVGQYEGNFQRDEFECDQELTEGDFACLDDVIRTMNCDLTQHASQVRDLRMMIAMNSIPVIAPAAGRFNGFPGPGSGPSLFGQPSGQIGAAPVFSGSFGGSGSDGLLLVPNVVGLPLPSAISVIATSGFVLGSVKQQSSSTANLLKGLFISTAHAQEVTGGTVINQTPTGGTRQQPGIKVNLIVQGGLSPVSVPEPSSLSIFVVGMLIMGGAYLYFRRRQRPGFVRS